MPADKAAGPRVLLIQPPVYDFALYDLYVKPAGLLSVGYFFLRAGYEVGFVDGLDYRDPVSAGLLGPAVRKADGTGKFFRRAVPMPAVLNPAGRAYARYGLDRDVFRRRISRVFGGRPPDLVLVGTGMTYWYPGVREAVETARSVFPGVPVLAGGVYATVLPDHCVKVCGADAVVQGPVYPGINDLLSRFGLPLIGPPEGGYRVLMEPAVWKDAGVLLLNRGCPNSCAYCASHLVSGPFVPGDPEVLFETVREMHRVAGTRVFAFYDDALLIRKEDVLFPFLERVLEAGCRFSFYLPNAVHVSMMDEQTAILLRRAGFREIRLGFESSSGEFHARLDGKVSGTGFDTTLAALRNAGFRFREITVYLLAGLPGQRAAEVEDSIEFVAARGVRISLSEYSPVPLSPLWQESVEMAGVDLAGEPLLQNNTFFPLEWSGFTREDMTRLKRRVREHNTGITG